MMIWCTGAGILVAADGTNFLDSFYCAVITSISVGYGTTLTIFEDAIMIIFLLWLLVCVVASTV
jgi:hypothetical protein